MEKHNFVREGVTRLPPGFRFQPTDIELLFQYLKCKIFSLPLPASIIPELHFSSFDPWDLPGDQEEERYFFTKKEAKYKRGTRTNRATCSGYWKPTGSNKHIISPPPTRQLNLGMTMSGLKKTLVFHEGKPPNGRRTDWFMHEYSLVLNDHQSRKFTSKIEDWIICHVFLKKRMEINYNAATSTYSSANYGLTTNSMEVDYRRLSNTKTQKEYHVKRTYSSCSSTSSSSSYIPRISSPKVSEYDDEETSSSP